MPTSTTEDYLKAIYHRSQDAPPEAWVSLGKIARDLSVTPGTVTTMVKGMSGRGLLAYRSRHGVQLTEEGRKTALDILRRHRLIELFLVQVMEISWSEVHKEAELLEHVVSDTLIQRMDEMLGHPTFDPHGSPIPTASGEMRSQQALKMADCEPGLYRVARVTGGSGEFLQWLKENGLVPGAEICLEQTDRVGGTLMLDVPGRAAPLSVGLQAASQLWVEPAGSG